MRRSIRAPAPAAARRPSGAPRLNPRELVLLAVAGRVAHPLLDRCPHRIGRDGVARLLPGGGGISLNHRVGDAAIGLAADRADPGVALRNDGNDPSADPGASNRALTAYACVGNRALVLDGPCRGKRGVVTGKRGGEPGHLLLDFPGNVLARLRIGDRIQVYAHGLGLRLPDHPQVQVHNCAPRLLRAWGVRAAERRLMVPVTHLLPAALLGTGLSDDASMLGGVEIQVGDPAQRRRFGLGRLRIGDMVALSQFDGRFGRGRNSGFISIGIIAYGDGIGAGHGPGITTLLTGPAQYIEPLRDRDANLALLLRLRRPARPRARTPLLDKQRDASPERPRVEPGAGATGSRVAAGRSRNRQPNLRTPA